MRPSEILSKAADLIEPEGCWVQHIYTNGVGAFCIYGAVDEITGVSRERSKCLDFIWSIIGTSTIGIWNDDPSRTRAEVISALRRASELAKQSEAAE